MANPTGPPPPAPFTRLNHPDPATNSIVQDLYDKLNVVAQSQASQNVNANPPAAAPPPSPAPNLRRITKSSTLGPDDHTVSANVQVGSSVLLPPTAHVSGKGPFIIQNQSGSGANLSLGSARAELVGGVAPTSYSLAPGQSLTLQPGPGYWIIVGQV